MATKRLKRPRDPVQLGKLIGDILTGQVKDGRDDGKDAAAAAMGKKGGTARAKSLSADQRRQIAKKAGQARWGKS